MKKTLIMTLLMTLAVSSAAAAPIYTYTETTPISSGVSLTNTQEFHTDGNISYSVIKADLTDPNTEFKLYKSPYGPDVADTVGNLAKANPGTIAAVNADFFSNHKNGKTLSLGIEVDNGKLIQSPINPDTMASVFCNGNSLGMSYLDFSITITAPNGQTAPVRHLNKHTDYYGDILMYTPTFNGGMSPAPGGEVCEVVVQDGIITEFRRRMPSVKIPDNGYILVVSEGMNMFLANNFQVGYPINITYTASPDVLAAKTAFGGGAMLIKDGVIPSEFSHVVSGKHPRSAIGIDRSGSTMYLVAVDGRQTKSRGMTMNELASFMLSLGCYNAVNLDGGGSTNMVASSPDNPELHTVNSPTENRRVINAVGLTYKGYSSAPAGIILKAEKSTVFVGHPVNITAHPYDENKRPYTGEIIWSADGGSIQNGVFIPEREGKVYVKASTGGVSETIEINCVQTITGVDIPSYIAMQRGETKTIPVSVFGTDENLVPVTNPWGFEVSSSNPSVITTNGFSLTAVSDGTAVVTIGKDGAKSHISVCVGGEMTSETVDFETLQGKYTGYPSYVKGSFELSGNTKFDGNLSGKLTYDFTTAEEVSKGAYFSFDKGRAIANSSNEISMMFYSPQKFEHEMRLQFTDGNGKIAIVPFGREYRVGSWQKLTAAIPENLVRPLTLTRVYALYSPGEAKDSGTVYIDSLSYPVTGSMRYSAPPENIYISPASQQTPTIAISKVSGDKTLLNSLVNSNIRKNTAHMPTSLTVGDINTFMVSESQNSLFVKVDVSKGGIRKTDTKQWENIINAVSSTAKENIFLLANTSVFGDDELENSVIKDYLASLDKNVFVITGAESNTMKKEKGVTYFTIGNRTDVYPDVNHLDNYKYLVFSEDGAFSWKTSF